MNSCPLLTRLGVPSAIGLLTAIWLWLGWGSVLLSPTGLRLDPLDNLLLGGMLQLFKGIWSRFCHEFLLKIIRGLLLKGLRAITLRLILKALRLRILLTTPREITLRILFKLIRGILLNTLLGLLLRLLLEILLGLSLWLLLKLLLGLLLNILLGILLKLFWGILLWLLGEKIPFIKLTRQKSAERTIIQHQTIWGNVYTKECQDNIRNKMIDLNNTSMTFTNHFNKRGKEYRPRTAREITLRRSRI